MKDSCFKNEGYHLINEINKQVWSGSFNVNIYTLKYQKKELNVIIDIEDIYKTSDRWKLGEHQIIGKIQFSNINIDLFKVENKVSWSLFNKKRDFEDFFNLEESKFKLSNNSNIKTQFLKLKNQGVLITGKDSTINFEFNINEKECESTILEVINELINMVTITK